MPPTCHAESQDLTNESPRTDWIDQLHQTGARRFASLGLPTRKSESWRYTDLRFLRDSGLLDSGVPKTVIVEPLPEPVMEHAIRVVFVNGAFCSSLSRLEENGQAIDVRPLGLAIEESHDQLRGNLCTIAALSQDSMVALNTARFRDGVIISVPENTDLKKPVEICFHGAAGDGPASWHPRNLILMGQGSSATVVEHHYGSGNYFSNSVSEIVLAPGARLDHCRLQEEGAEAIHIAMTAVTVGADACYDNFSLATGARIGRNQITVTLQEPGACCHLNGAYLARGRQHLETNTLIDHAAEHCNASELYRGVIDDHARGVFQGRIIVRKHAQKTDSHQGHKALLLSRRAEVNAKPELEIYADDVRCGHGATIGELDDDALFYLRSRGIPHDLARQMLIEAFIDDSFGFVSNPNLTRRLRLCASSWYGSST